MVSILQKPKSSRSSFTALLLVICAISTVKFLKHVEQGTSKRVNLSAYYGKVEAKESEEIPKLHLSPSTKNVFINVGSNFDPIMPDEKLGPCAHTIAVEPVVANQIKPHPQLSVIPAAVANNPGVMSMKVMNWNGVSSSLVDVRSDYPALKSNKYTVVPVITLSSLLNSIPSTAKISVLMTDIQGLDFTAIKEAAEVIKEKVTHLKTEVWKNDEYTYDAKNDLCRDWIPFMEELGMRYSLTFLLFISYVTNWY